MVRDKGTKDGCWGVVVPMVSGGAGRSKDNLGVSCKILKLVGRAGTALDAARRISNPVMDDESIISSSRSEEYRPCCSCSAASRCRCVLANRFLLLL